MERVWLLPERLYQCRAERHLRPSKENKELYNRKKPEWDASLSLEENDLMRS